MTTSTRADKMDEMYDFHAAHVVWCTNRDAEFTIHSDDEPYCSHSVTRVIPEGDVVKCQAWVAATRAFTHGQFATAESAEREQRYAGIEIVLENWRGPNAGSVTQQKVRVSSDAARTLAAALIRAADIEQGLTR